MGKHPVSTTIKMELNKEIDEICRQRDCSKYRFIREAITEKMERIKNERENESGQDSERVRRDKIELRERANGHSDGFEEPVEG